MVSRCRLEDIYAVAEALKETLTIQEANQPLLVADGALILTKNATDTRWFRALAARATAICFPCGRLKETTTLQGPALFYFGAQVDAFTRLCSPFGWVGIPLRKGGA
jgi:hypothetical protein